MPEIIYGATVYGANGRITSNTLGFPADGKGYVRAFGRIFIEAVAFPVARPSSRV